VTRLTIRPLSVRETSLSAFVLLPSGTVLSGCRVERHDDPADGTEPYLVHFAVGGHSYTCPLFAFQPRTQSLTAEFVEAPRVPDAVAV